MARNPSNPFREISSIENQNLAVPPSNPPAPVNHSVPAKNVTVEVSGSRFCIIPSLFKHIEKLHWKRNGETLRLNANPDVFEMILQYFMFSSLPDYSGLSHRKATELLDLVSPLEPGAAQKLVQYVEHYIVTTPNPKATNTSSSFLRKRFPSFSSRSSWNKTNSSQRPVSSTVSDNNAHIVVPSHIRTTDTNTQ